ncbi:hypothetical protein BG003_001904, partial [Podila horticola]
GLPILELGSGSQGRDLLHRHLHRPVCRLLHPAGCPQVPQQVAGRLCGQGQPRTHPPRAIPYGQGRVRCRGWHVAKARVL